MRKRRAPRQPAPATVRADAVPAERHQHDVIEVVEVVHFGDGKDVQPHRALAPRVTTQRMIDRYLIGRNISEAQHRAAERFWADWYNAGRAPRTTANLEGVGGGGYDDGGTARQVDASVRYSKALDVLDLYDCGFIIDVVCFDKPVGGKLMKNRVTVRTRFDRLREALDRLAKHYGVG